MNPTTKLLAALLVLCVCAGTWADVPRLRVECYTPGETPTPWYPQGVDNGDGTYTFSGTYSDPEYGDWTLNLQNVTVRSDPFINAVYGVTNNLGTTQNLILSVSVPVSPTITPSSLIGGSTGGSINDANFDGVGTLATLGSGQPFYAGLIDGVTVLPLYADPFSVSVPFAGGTALIPALNAGLPGPTIPGPAVLSSIGIDHRFSLTAHDTAALTSFFVAVPEPTTGALLALGGLLLAARRH